jgi:hypothetical protein
MRAAKPVENPGKTRAKPVDGKTSSSVWHAELAAFVFVFVTLTRVLTARCTSHTFVTYSTATRLAAPCSTLSIFVLLALATLVWHVQSCQMECMAIRSYWLKGFLKGVRDAEVSWMLLVCVTSSFSSGCSMNMLDGIARSEGAHSYGVLLYSTSTVVVDVGLSCIAGFGKQSDFSLIFQYCFYTINGCAFFLLCYASLFSTKEGWGSSVAGLFEYLSLTSTLIYYMFVHLKYITRF